MKSGRKLCALLLAASALGGYSALALAQLPAAQAESASSLEQQFRDPPNSARPRVWWHWMNGNVTKDGIAKDMAWMKRVGIGGLQNFDAELMTPQIVEKRLVYMTPEWKDAFRFAANEAERQGLELAIAASPGWSETGGPWVPLEDGLKKLVWSDTDVVGGRPFTGKLAAPPSKTGPYQTIGKQPGIEDMIANRKPTPAPTHYADVAVLAFPLDSTPPLPQPKVLSADGQIVDGQALFDADLESAVQIKAGTATAPATLTLDYQVPQTVQSASLFIPGGSAMFQGNTTKPHLEASDDGKVWRIVADLPSGPVPATISFPAVRARYFRLVMAPGAMGGGLGPPAAGADESPMFANMAARGKAPINIGSLLLTAEPRIDLFETKAGFAVTHDYYALSKGVPETKGIAPSAVIDLTSKLRPDGSLDWTPPKGRWRIVRFGYSLLGTENHPAPREATGLEVDKFDGAAVKRYLDHYIGMYRDAAGADRIGNQGVRAILTDSIEVGAANWTPLMLQKFRSLRGYDPLPWLPALTGIIVGSRAESDRFLYDYRRTLADLIATEHYGTVAKVAHENGLKVYGEALENGRPSLGDDMEMRRFADVPMAAMWTHNVGDPSRWTRVADIRGAASVAHIYGQNLVAAESLTSSNAPWAHSPATLKRIIDLEFVSGLNRPVIHTSVHQPLDDKFPGLSLFIFGQYFNRHESWAEMAKPWVDYLSRNGLMLQQGRNFADVAYFYGEDEPLASLYENKPTADAPRANAFDFVNPNALTDALRNDGAELVTPGGARYRALYLGGTSRKMTLATLRRIAALAEGGATIVGMAPEGDPGRSGDSADYAALVAKLWPAGGDARVGQGRVIASNDINAALAKIGVGPDFTFTGGQTDSSIPFLHRKLADGDSYFLVNEQQRGETIEARFRVTGKAPELWHAETGLSEPVSYRIENGVTIVPLTLGAEESVHVVFRKPAASDALAIKKLAPTSLARLDGPWSVALQPGRGAPASATLPQLAPLNANADPGIKYFSGIATYSKDFSTPRGWKAGQPLWLDLGQVHEIAEVLVNGKSVGSVWHAPYRIDISSAARSGKNRLEVRVANLWVNRLIGDAQPGAQKITFTASPAYRANAPLRPSGLIGPVELMGASR